MASQKRRAFRYSIFGALAVAVLFGVYLYTRPNVVVVDLSNFENPIYGRLKGAAEEYFSREFPSAEEIEDYWKDSTLVVSDRKLGNGVRYFDDDHHFVSWAGGGLLRYEWALFPEQQLLKLGPRSRSVVIQKFCIRSLDNPESTPDDNCRLVPITSELYKRGTTEHRKGDVFGLRDRSRPPFGLPQGPITVESLLAQFPKS